MYLGVINFIKGLFTFGSPRHVTDSTSDDHSYIRGKIENRGPCPGINSLANHGYLPRDGKNITATEVETALKTALHMDGALAKALADSLKPLIRADGTFDLVDMRQHNVLEHDRSPTRHDIIQGDNYTFQPALFEAMLKDAAGGPFTLKSLAKTYRRREKESKEAGSPPLPLNLKFVILMETVAFFHGSQLGDQLPLEHVRAFYLEERFSNVVLQNKSTRTMAGLLKNAATVLFYITFGS